MAQQIKLGELADLHIAQWTYTEIKDAYGNNVAVHPGWPQGTVFYITSSNPAVVSVKSKLTWYGQPYQYEMSPHLSVLSLGSTTLTVRIVKPDGTTRTQTQEIEVVDYDPEFKCQVDQDMPSYI